jgi:hypothetical protein
VTNRTLQNIIQCYVGKGKRHEDVWRNEDIAPYILGLHPEGVPKQIQECGLYIQERGIKLVMILDHCNLR